MRMMGGGFDPSLSLYPPGHIPAQQLSGPPSNDPMMQVLLHNQMAINHSMVQLMQMMVQMMARQSEEGATGESPSGPPESPPGQ